MNRKKAIIVVFGILFITIIIIILCMKWREDFLQKDTSSLKSMFFLSGKELYYYDVQKRNVENVGKSEKFLSNAVISKDKKNITAVYSGDGINIEGIMKYCIETGEWEEKLGIEQIENLSSKEYRSINIFSNGEEAIIHYQQGQFSEVFSYNLETRNHRKILEGSNIREVQCLEDRGIIYIEQDELKTYNPDSGITKVLVEKFDVQGSVKFFQTSYDENNLIVMKEQGTQKANQRIYLYNISEKKYKEICPARWNIYYGTNFQWDSSDDYIFYTEAFPGLFQASKQRIFAYNVTTKEKIMLHKIDEYTYESFAFIREEK